MLRIDYRNVLTDQVGAKACPGSNSTPSGAGRATPSGR